MRPLPNQYSYAVSSYRRTQECKLLFVFSQHNSYRRKISGKENMNMRVCVSIACGICGMRTLLKECRMYVLAYNKYSSMRSVLIYNLPPHTCIHMYIFTNMRLLYCCLSTKYLRDSCFENQRSVSNFN